MADEGDWYYESAGSPVGPISADEFAVKRSTAVITPDTKVWKPGMDDWAPLRSVPSAPGGEMAISALHAPPDTTTQCDECSRPTPKDELLAYGNLQICTACKETFVDKLKQGVRVGGGPWRDRKAILFYADTDLPKRCLKCNEPAEHSITRNLSHTNHLLLLLVLIGGLPGILIYVLIAFFIRQRAMVTAYLCTKHRKSRTLFLTINWTVTIVLTLTLILLSVMTFANNDFLIVVISLSVLGLLICAIAGLRLQLFRVQKIKDGLVRASGPSRKFLDSLQPWRDS